MTKKTWPKFGHGSIFQVRGGFPFLKVSKQICERNIVDSVYYTYLCDMFLTTLFLISTRCHLSISQWEWKLKTFNMKPSLITSPHQTRNSEETQGIINFKKQKELSTQKKKGRKLGHLFQVKEASHFKVSNPSIVLEFLKIILVIFQSIWIKQKYM